MAILGINIDGAYKSFERFIEQIDVGGRILVFGNFLFDHFLMLKAENCIYFSFVFSFFAYHFPLNYSYNRLKKRMMHLYQ